MKRGVTLAAGAGLLLLWLTLAALKWRAGLLPEMLWMCHLGSLLLAFGLLSGWGLGSAVGFLFCVAVAAPAYALHLLSGGETTAVSFALHLLAPVAGWWAWRGQALPRFTAACAFAGYLGVAALCWAATPESLNINLVFAPWAPFASVPLWLYRAGNALLMLALLCCVQWLFNLETAVDRSPPLAAPHE